MFKKRILLHSFCVLIVLLLKYYLTWISDNKLVRLGVHYRPSQKTLKVKKFVCQVRVHLPTLQSHWLTTQVSQSAEPSQTKRKHGCTATSVMKNKKTLMNIWSTDFIFLEMVTDLGHNVLCAASYWQTVAWSLCCSSVINKQNMLTLKIKTTSFLSVF